MKKAVIMAGVIAVCFLQLAASLDWTSFPDPIQKGSFMISPSFSPGSCLTGGSIVTDLRFLSLNGNVSVDYALPIGLPLIIGFETGYLWSNTTIKHSYDEYDGVYLSYVPFVLHLAWHPNLQVKGIDAYIVGKAGFGLAFWSGNNTISSNGLFEMKNGYGHILGIDIGCRYFFNERIGLYLEAGYDRYYFFYEKSYSSGVKDDRIGYFDKFGTVGFTVLF